VVDPITLASGRFEVVAIDDRDLAVVAAYEPRALKLSRGLG